MNQKNYLILDNEFLKYCELNKIHDVQKFAQDIFQKGFTIIKYGETPMGFSSEKIVEKEVIKEIIKEVPVEKVVEKIVEVIKEVPVERIVEVTKEVFNNEEILRLQEENQKLKSELEKITTSLESFGKKGKLMRDSNLSSLYDE